MPTKNIIIHPAPGSVEARIIALFAHNIKRLLAGKVTTNQHERNRERIQRVWNKFDECQRTQGDLFTTN